MTNREIIKNLDREQLERFIFAVMNRWDYVNKCEFVLYLEEAVGTDRAKQLLSNQYY